ncbi:Abi-alpha family protein [Anatilimnocola floriformis]|uniref:Abi-alpha family protein n=1 Tax=Anatilimnocola floriformis TaxID=2948575 RepID=UPI0020C2D432|nr:Abi-alpha family protein [Anatilimnocola floriformis]
MSEGDGGINDLAGVGEVLNSEVANKAYDDGLSNAMKSTGEGLTDVVDGLRLFLLPFNLLSIARVRILRFMGIVRNDVPPERQIEAAPEIAGPVLEKLRYQRDDDPLTELYLNLLKRAIDKERRDEAHPAFASIIAQLSADEALFLYRVWKIAKDLRHSRLPLFFQANYQGTGPFGKNFDLYLTHLRGLTLLEQPEVKLQHRQQIYSGGIEDSDFTGIRVEQKINRNEIKLTPLGRLFCQAVLPDQFQGEEVTESSPD